MGHIDHQEDQVLVAKWIEDWLTSGFTEQCQSTSSRWIAQSNVEDKLWKGQPHLERIRFLFLALHPDGRIEGFISARWQDDSAITLPPFLKAFSTTEEVDTFCALWGITLFDRAPLEDARRTSDA